MSVTLVKGVTLATFSGARSADNPRKTAGSTPISAANLSAQVSVRLASEAAVLSGRSPVESSAGRVRDYQQAEERANDVAQKLREDADLGEGAYANLDGSIPPDGFVI